MRVLVLGANGFVGRHVVAALQWHGHTVVKGVSPAARARQAAADDVVAVDFGHDTDPQVWLPRLKGVDAVVNAVGVLRDTRARPMQAIHTDTPVALFEACAIAQIARVVHVSALGIASNPTGYGVTKRAAEAAFLAQIDAGLYGTLVRPSVVFGQGGESSALFLNLARLPVGILPAVAWRTRIQPIHVMELAEAIARVLDQPLDKQPRVLEVVGEQAVPLAEFISSLRQQMGRNAPWLLKLPDGLTAVSARLGDWVPVTPWGSEALSLLSHDNTASVGPVADLLGRMPTHYSQLLRYADSVQASGAPAGRGH